MTANAAETITITDQPEVLTLGADLSPAVKAIETAYRMIQRRYADAPPVTIVVKRDERAWGHTTVAKVWAPRGTDQADRFEIMISGENLKRGAVAVAGTLLHEAAHARNLARGVLDTDTNGRHNGHFKATAEQHGLTVTSSGWHGYAATELQDAGAENWRQLVATIDKGLQKSAATATPGLDHLGIVAPTGETETGTDGAETPAKPVAPRKRGNRNLLVATCGCGLKIRLSRGVWEACSPQCQQCGEPFELAE